MPAKKSTRSKTPSVRVKSYRRRSPEVSRETETRQPVTPQLPTETATEAKEWHGTGWIALAFVSVVAAAMLIAAPGPSRPGNAAAAATTPDKRANEPTMARAGDAVDATKATNPKTASAAAPVKTSGEEIPGREMGPGLASVTITGCLERADDVFRLKNAVGADAPKSRSWKTGFLKRESTRIDVVDASRRWNLPGHVGQRVSVTGTLVDREMRIQSLSRVSSSCTASSMAS